MFDLDILWNVELMYLLTFRAWCEINVVVRTFNSKKVKPPETNKKKKSRPKREAQI